MNDDPIILTQEDVKPELREIAPITEEDRSAKRIAVVEIFGPTIQGEGPLAGSKTMFVRFGGCDYRCQKCDSLHAVIPAAVKANARYLTAEEIVDELCVKRRASGTQWVTLSGGNPLMWDLERLVALLNGNNFNVAVETQGTLFRPWLLKCQMVVISPKSPGMGERFDADRFTHMVTQLFEARVTCAIKVVCFSALDIDFAAGIWETMRPHVPPHHEGMFFLSLGNPYPPVLDPTGHLQENPYLAGDPAFEDFDPERGKNHLERLMSSYRQLIEEFVQDPRFGHARFIPQLHVLAYSNEAER